MNEYYEISIQLPNFMMTYLLNIIIITGHNSQI